MHAASNTDLATASSSIPLLPNTNHRTNNPVLLWFTGPNLIAFDLTGPKTHAIKTHARAAAITPYMVGFKFLVHNGKVYNDVYVTEEMVGRKLGEFSP